MNSHVIYLTKEHEEEIELVIGTEELMKYPSITLVPARISRGIYTRICDQSR